MCGGVENVREIARTSQQLLRILNLASSCLLLRVQPPETDSEMSVCL